MPQPNHNISAIYQLEMQVYRKCRFTGWAACRTLSLALHFKRPNIRQNLSRQSFFYQSSVSLTWRRLQKSIFCLVGAAVPRRMWRGSGGNSLAFLLSVSRLCPSATLRPLHKTTDTMTTSLPSSWPPRFNTLTYIAQPQGRWSGYAQRQKHCLLAFWNHVPCRVARTSRFMRGFTASRCSWIKSAAFWVCTYTQVPACDW